MLTFDGNFCDIARCSEIRGGEHCQDGYCSQRRVWERLKEYEDTGLTPESLARAFNEKVILELAGQALGVSPDRLREMAQAEQDGRLVVLPCKVGDKVYRVAKEKKYSEWHRRMMYLEEVKYIEKPKSTIYLEEITIKPENAHKYINEVGKTVFLSREEAEAVLEAQKVGQKGET